MLSAAINTSEIYASAITLANEDGARRGEGGGGEERERERERVRVCACVCVCVCVCVCEGARDRERHGKGEGRRLREREREKEREREREGRGGGGGGKQTVRETDRQTVPYHTPSALNVCVCICCKLLCKHPICGKSPPLFFSFKTVRGVKSPVHAHPSLVHKNTALNIQRIQKMKMKKKNPRFFTISSQRRELSPTRVQVAQAQSCANHVQHIERLSRATCIMCHLVRRDSSATKFGRVEIAFFLACWLTLTELRVHVKRRQ